MSGLVLILAILQDSLNNSFPENPSELFWRLNNPIFIAVIVAAGFLLIAYLIMSRQVIPRLQEYEKEKTLIENKYTKSMALLAEAAPDPVLRINKNGIIIFSNNAGYKFGKKLIGTPIISIFQGLNSINFKTFITSSFEKTTDLTFNENTYNAILKGIPDLDAIQIYFTDITAIKNYEKELTASKEKLAELSGHLQTILETERSRISKELHDGLGQTLSFLRLKLDSLKNDAGTQDEKKKTLDELNLSINNAVMELKNISYDLKPRLLEIHGLIPALQMMVEQVSGSEGIKGTFEHFDVSNIKPRLEITIYRICQELINNIIKHSKASFFSIQISQDEQSVKLIVDDDGIGFEKPKTNFNDSKLRGMGLISITERVEAFKGEINIDSTLGNGTVVAIEFPVLDYLG